MVLFIPIMLSCVGFVTASVTGGLNLGRGHVGGEDCLLCLPC